MTLKISISGIRGITGESLTNKVCSDFAKAFATYIVRGTIIVGRDPRASGEQIKDLMIKELRALGLNIIYIGIAPTPTVQLMVKHLGADGGLIITASHNPVEWNGLKFVRRDGIFLNETQANRLIHIYSTGKFKKPFYPDKRGTKPGTLKKLRDAYSPHINAVLKCVDVKAIRKKKFRVAMDSCNGAGSIIIVKMLKKLGCKVIEINTNMNKPFPHNPEPIPENLKQLCDVVKKKKADIGFAQDADADRLALVTEKGIAPGEEYTLAIAVGNVLARSKKPLKVVTNLSTSLMTEVMAKRYGAHVTRTKIGEVNVAEEMKSQLATIGGEGNGGVIHPAVGYNRDSLIGAALLLDELAKFGKKTSELIDSVPKFYIVKNKVQCASKEDADLIILKIKNAFKNEKLDLTEGVKVVFDDAWLHVRASNTEPIVRIFAEASSEKKANELIQKALSAKN